MDWTEDWTGVVAEMTCLSRSGRGRTEERMFGVRRISWTYRKVSTLGMHAGRIGEAKRGAKAVVSRLTAEQRQRRTRQLRHQTPGRTATTDLLGARMEMGGWHWVTEVDVVGRCSSVQSRAQSGAFSPVRVTAGRPLG